MKLQRVAATPDGAEAWTQTDQEGAGSGVAVAANGDVVVAGTIWADGVPDIFVVRYDSAGEVLDSRTLGCDDESAKDEGHEVVTDAEGAAYVTGQRCGSTIWIARLL